MMDVFGRVGRDYLNDVPFLGSIGKMGAYGNISFRIGTSNTLVPNDISFSTGNETTSHTRIGKPDITEFIKRKLKSSSFDIKLIYTLAPIKSTIRKLEKIIEEGEHYPLIIGDFKISENTFMLKSMNVKITKVDGAGTPLVADVSLSLEEYISEITETTVTKYVKEKGTTSLKKKVIHNANSEVIKVLKGGRLW